MKNSPAGDGGGVFALFIYGMTLYSPMTTPALLRLMISVRSRDSAPLTSTHSGNRSHGETAAGANKCMIR